MHASSYNFSLIKLKYFLTVTNNKTWFNVASHKNKNRHYFFNFVDHQ